MSPRLPLAAPGRLAGIRSEMPYEPPAPWRMVVTDDDPRLMTSWSAHFEQPDTVSLPHTMGTQRASWPF
jgi:hypothetical protein